MTKCNDGQLFAHFYVMGCTQNGGDQVKVNFALRELTVLRIRVKALNLGLFTLLFRFFSTEKREITISIVIVALPQSLVVSLFAQALQVPSAHRTSRSLLEPVQLAVARTACVVSRLVPASNVAG